MWEQVEEIWHTIQQTYPHKLWDPKLFHLIQQYMGHGILGFDFPHDLTHAKQIRFCIIGKHCSGASTMAISLASRFLNHIPTWVVLSGCIDNNAYESAMNGSCFIHTDRYEDIIDKIIHRSNMYTEQCGWTGVIIDNAHISNRYFDRLWYQPNTAIILVTRSVHSDLAEKLAMDDEVPVDALVLLQGAISSFDTMQFRFPIVHDVIPYYKIITEQKHHALVIEKDWNVSVYFHDRHQFPLEHMKLGSKVMRTYAMYTSWHDT